MENENLNSNNAGNEPVEEVTFDDILKDKTYQSEYDRRVAKALETGKANWEKEYKQKMEEEKSEAKRMAKMTAEEQMAERVKKIEDREKELQRKELISQTKEELNKVNLPLAFAEYLVNNNDKAENILSRVGELKEVFNSQVETLVKERMAGETPKASNSNTNEARNQALRQAMGLD